jgi:hypothetical protein
VNALRPTPLHRMKILFGHGTPAPLRHALTGHAVSTAYERGWSGLDNGALIASAENGFDVLITTDKNLRHQQALPRLRLAILVLPTTSWPRIRTYASQIFAVVNALRPGDVVELDPS